MQRADACALREGWGWGRRGRANWAMSAQSGGWEEGVG